MGTLCYIRITETNMTVSIFDTSIICSLITVNPAILAISNKKILLGIKSIVR